MRRGEAADDPAVASLAVAQARMVLRRREERALALLGTAGVVAYAALAAWAFARGHFVLGLVLAVVVLSGGWLLWRMSPPAFVLAGDAERRNRDALERAGRPYVDDSAGAEPAAVPVGAIAVGVVVLWITDALALGSVRRLADGGPSTLGPIVASGAVLATVLAVSRLAWMRRRMARESQRPIA